MKAKEILSNIQVIRFIYRVIRLILLPSTKLPFKKYPVIDGLPYPWLTRPCVDYLENIGLDGKSILEFGSGYSTAYFDRKGASVISYEREEYWIQYLKTMVSVNVDLRHFTDESQEGSEEYFNLIYESLLKEEKKFDVLVVDVFPRPKTLDLFIDLVSKDGFIIFDNSDWYPEYFKDLKNRNNLLVVDFYGQAIGGLKDQCTSVIFKRNNISFTQKGGASKFSSGVISSHDREPCWKD